MKWYHRIPEYLPTLFYGPVALLAIMNQLQGVRGSISRVAEGVGLDPWGLIIFFIIMAFLSVLPFGYKWRIAMMGGIVVYALLSAYVMLKTTGQWINTLFGLYILLVVFVYPVTASILSVHLSAHRLEREHAAQEKADHLLSIIADLEREIEGIRTDGTG